MAGSAGPALAAGDISDLGKLTTDVPGYYDVPGGFGKVAARSHAPVQVILFDTPWGNDSAITRWPLVKALEQFGTWSGLAVTAASEPLYPASQGPNGTQFAEVPGVATYDLSHVRYRSRYISFKHYTVQRQKGGPLARLPRTAQQLLNKILRIPLDINPNLPSDHNVEIQLPAILIGGFGTHGAPTDPAFGVGQGTSVSERFESIRSQLAGSSTTELDGTRDLNAYTNVIVTYVCYQDGMRPRSVCRTHTVHAIMTMPHFAH